MEAYITWLIYFHAAFGGIALCIGTISIIVKKGSKLHKRAGKVFYFSMLVSALTSLVIAMLPNHENPFLFSIGVFTIYLLLTGYRGLRFKGREVVLRIDSIISICTVVTGIGMLLTPVLMNQNINIVLFVFGLLAALFGIRDLRLYKNKELLKKSWLKIHIGKMTGAYISAVSAFLVVNDLFYSLLNWFLPTILGSLYITYWILKVDNKLPKTKSK